MRCTYEFWIFCLSVSDLPTARCIDQKYAIERTHQVQLMGLIYKKCEECIVYLGDSLDGTGPSLTEAPPVWHFEEGVPTQSGKKSASRNPGVYEIFSFFHDLASEEHLLTQLAFGDSAIPFKPGSQHDGARFQLQLFEALRKFTHAPFTPWWTRIWVIQEVTTPPHVVITHGTISASWDMFARGGAKYTHHSADCCKKVVQRLPPDQQKVVADSCRKIIGIDSLRWSTQSLSIHPDLKSLGLLSLLTQFRDRKASDPRDKVYALLSMTWTPPGRTPLVPDYSLSETEVFCRAALQSIYTTSSLSMFSTELGRKFRSDLPSWVPDWGAPGGHTYAARAQTIRLYNANRDKATPLTVRSITESALRLRAARIMTVRVLGETMLGDDATYTRQTLHEWWRLWNSHTSGVNDGLPLKTPVDNRFTTLLCAGMIHLTYAGLSHGVRTVQAYDANTFESWAAYSSTSPVGKPDETSVVDDLSVHTQLWKHFLLLWPNYHLLQFRDPLDGRDEYFPNGLDHNTLDGVQLIARLRQLLGCSVTGRDIGLLDYFEGPRPRPHAPWKNLFIKAQQSLQNIFGADINLHLQGKKSFVPEVDNSISIATLSRRLIIGEDFLRWSPVTGNHFFGLGPAGTVEGDEVFLLTGGKTPFVLRRRDDTDDTIPGPRYEIIGDCYLQGLMDGEGEGLALDPWEDITLV